MRLEEGSDDTLPLGARYAELASRGIRDLTVAVMVGNWAAQMLHERRGLQPAEIVLYRFGSLDRKG